MSHITIDEESILRSQTDWHKKSRQGCVFAGTIATKIAGDTVSAPFQNYWARKVVRGYSEAAVKEMAALIHESYQDPQRQIASVLLPDITEPAHLAQFVRSIEQHYQDSLVAYENSTNGGQRTLVRIQLPLGDGVRAFALGFAKAPGMPKTRWAPYVELVVPTKTKQQLKDRYSRHALHLPQPDSIPRSPEPTYVHLADIQVEGVTEKTDKDTRLWEATKVLKIAKLDGETNDQAAKGKVTFTFEGPASQFGK